ncbi:hypothetical protein Q9R08_11135 [Microbacterium sp. QXD-8]|uniref:DUF1049 domain-containing protein n=1 Tax=Microbacterium psychrotolerans TaxID=3068321 RepID=A0ABU0Z1S5_9MICO|nr:hypothetical protein [Microbacterium sp. QXD-8]MDQ7878530.1 hypothetical protein [Microbacterium sp. QXD-8]
MSTPETPDAARGADATTPVDDLTPPPPESPESPSVLPPAFTGTLPPAWEPPTAASDRLGTAESDPPGAAASVALSRPRVRWAGIVWGLVLATIAAGAVWFLTDPARQDALASWLVSLSPATTIAIGVLVLGGFALITGVVGIARRAQRGIEQRRTSASAAGLR